MLMLGKLSHLVMVLRLMWLWPFTWFTSLQTVASFLLTADILTSDFQMQNLPSRTLIHPKPLRYQWNFQSCPSWGNLRWQGAPPACWQLRPLPSWAAAAKIEMVSVPLVGRGVAQPGRGPWWYSAQSPSDCSCWRDNATLLSTLSD